MSGAAVATAATVAQVPGAQVKKRPVVGRLKVAKPMDGKIAAIASANGVPPKLAVAIVRIESGYNPRAANGGALGLMQIKPRTAAGVGFHGGAGALLDADVNLRFGMRYLAQAYRAAHGDTCGTVMRYQSGLYATYFSGANRAYCAKARSIMASL
ncbi:MAG: transglycosylase SLT domain-containing protein [Hyphomicrobiales bacterium]|nr:transglycosylase SLT domain-containing protein [Hyphomicrobiales bacterium]MDE2017910.1 transglycosylase SLT domain-containing protein [Hyphomicrobiales bacterium]